MPKLLKSFGFNANSSILDIGSGYGRLVYGILHELDFRGSYLGFDVLPRQIKWCRDNITTPFPQCRFELVDIRNDRYNPNGGIAASAVRFDAPNAAFDFCALFSVFTHMYEADIRQYLAEIRRMLRDDGVAVTTFFLFDAARWPGGQSRDVGLTMRHELNDHTRYHNTEDRLHAMAYDRNWIERLLLDNGFETLKIIPGRWAGSSSPHYQDQVVFRKQRRETAVVFEAST